VIKAVASGADGAPVVFLGLSRENCTRLLANQPIPVRLRELHPDLPDLTVMLLGGETEDDIAEDLRVLGPPARR
jgi:hypothetical protein